MEPYRDDNELTAELRALRPAPSPAFAATLDERATAGFPRRPLLGDHRLERLAAKLRVLPPRRIAFSAGAAALASVAIATAVVVGIESNRGPSAELKPIAPQEIDPFGGRLAGKTNGQDGYLTGPSGELGEQPLAASSKAGSVASEAEAATPEPPSPSLRYLAKSSANATNASHRDVERSASIVLGADPADVAGDAARVSETVHANGGIVLRSSISNGSAAHVGASFLLLVPSAHLDDTMAAFAQIDEVRLRNEGSLDITAPTVDLSEQIKDSQARIDGLLAQLATAETESAREAVEAELSSERHRHAALRSRLTNLHRRAHFSRVSLRIESGSAPASPGGGWGVGDALDDAGHVLSVAAGVALVGLAVLAPAALIALLVWLAHRAWLRRSRARALG
ncbi:MAG TPA: DUF4349 domain-containing protein [Solirubrobacterales bacterium]|jgi:hypothetical protein|nr:DUF4349 domain-containing protein [Solirubrobacterales bacterium]